MVGGTKIKMTPEEIHNLVVASDFPVPEDLDKSKSEGRFKYTNDGIEDDVEIYNYKGNTYLDISQYIGGTNILIAGKQSLKDLKQYYSWTYSTFK